MGSTFTLYTPMGVCDVTLSLPGRHNVINALAAAAAAIAVGADLEQIKQGLKSSLPVSGRLQTRAGFNGSTVIDDTYNANPKSMLAAMHVLAASPGAKILVIGDMKELGGQTRDLHTEVGVQAKHAGIDRLLTFGTLSRHAAESFGDGAHHFENKTDLIESLKPVLDDHTTVLVKGSRGVRMEEVVQAITANRVTH